MFRSATLRLTIWYTLIIMIISLIFSVVLYNIARQQIETTLRRQIVRTRIESQLGFDQLSPPDIAAELQDGSNQLLFNLFEFNMVILILGGLSSYGLAKRTLRPIAGALESQRQFTADASHELRTPLTAMKTELEVSLRNPRLRDKDTRVVLASNLEEVNKLERLSTSLLHLSRYEENGDGLKMANKLDMKKLIADALKPLEQIAKSRQVKLDAKLKSGFVHGDESSLREMITVLMDNAIKYSPKSEAVEVSGQADGRQYVLQIVDHGTGISSTDLPHIFDRFYRADSSRSKTKVDGFGLGLAIAKKICELHHGTIQAKSSGNGASFTVYLPLA